MRYDQWDVKGRGAAMAGVPPLVGRVLSARGFQDPAAAREFLRTDPGLLRDPFLMKDMDKAAARVQAALDRGETFAVYGDYDVDGMSAACLLYDFFTRQGGRVLRHIPQRLTEGYGLNKNALRDLREQGCGLVVTVDCGITAVEEVEYAKSIGLEVVVTDHHTCKDTLPDALAVVDPLRPDCPYPFKGLAGVGVALKLAMAMGARLEDYVDYAALGTVADVMPLVEENRAIVALGLKLLGRRPGIRALLEEAGAEAEDMNAATLSYTICPRLNAAGRLGVTRAAEELLLEKDLGQALPLARQLCELNRERQKLEGDIFEQCVARLSESGGQDKTLVLAGEGWHQGVVGIVASRLAERYDKPAFIISLEKGMGKGSCRSVPGVSLFRALEHCGDLLEGFGGHDMAAGFTVREENIPALRGRLNEWVAQRRGEGAARVLEADCLLEDGKLLTLENVEALEMLEPFGAGNPKPVFILPGCEAVTMSRVGDQGRHLKLLLRRDEALLGGIFFSFPQEGWTMGEGDWVDAAFTPQVNHFRGRSSVQLLATDLRPAQAQQGERELYQKYCRGDALTAQEARSLIPSREEFEGVWRYLRARAPLEGPAGVLAGWLATPVRGPGRQARALLSLRIFEERGLVQLERRQTTVTVTLRPQAGKVDLEESPILRGLRRTAEA